MFSLLIYIVLGIFYGAYQYRVGFNLLSDHNKQRGNTESAELRAWLMGIFWIFVLPSLLLWKGVNKVLDKFTKM